MKIPTAVLEVLDRAETDGPRLTLTGTLDRKLYLDTAKVLEAAGGKWSRKERAHLFDSDAADVIETVILTGEIVSKRQQFGYFPTPNPVVRQLIDLAGIEPGMRVLEPSAGRGAIALAAADAGAVVDCVEIQAEHADALRDAHHPDVTVLVADFLTTNPQPVYDRVVMNPPFARQADIAHVRHAWTALKPGGRLVAVMSAGVTFRQNAGAVAFRAWLEASGGRLVPLPEGAFQESGTGVNTVIAVIPRPAV
ncbi:methyltransferase [Streptomyces europaeiscabiei]|uniref:Methyltransferase n=1 Tax=Streptomyces europaeiscabiei TaxID=146819 RepID=A0ABU4NWE2_9ACTN|nr:methyltransferase [Streptomyces europaeiscabiei]MDX2528010.1 methyltransferase [Streptomyces europaeiscabiei]MDX3550133.1 methyltransferase [Streptomyces europaeiscabiei]MDX3558813.1 methyltransferase [Streptomyces europaeiscabiei]MDX3707251.1 methyltransferase [Streptomyces europaeiscabiei]